MVLIYILCAATTLTSFYYNHVVIQHNLLKSIVYSFIIGYIPTYFNRSHLKGGMIWKRFRMSKAWNYFSDYFDASIHTEVPLDSNQTYIFCSFPHGACKCTSTLPSLLCMYIFVVSLNHILTMTDCCGMLSKVYSGKRVDLAASVLFFIPLLKEVYSSPLYISRHL